MTPKKKFIYIVAVPQSMTSFILPRVPWMLDEYDLVGICSPGADCDVLRASGMRLIEVPIARHISPLQDLKSLWQLWRVLRRERPDIVHSLTPKAGLLGMAAAFLARVPVRLHSFTGLIFPWRHGLLQLILKTTDKLTCLFATHINPEGAGVKGQLEAAHITSKRMDIIAHGNINGVDLARFAPKANRESVRSELGLCPENRVFCFVGRMVSDKGLPELVRCFSALHETHPEARLLLIGHEEPELDPLPADTCNAIEQHPAIMALGTRHDIERMLAATDIFVMPSHREGFCNSLLEAGAMALPSITYDICGCNDSVDNSTGILVPPYDEGALHNAMVQLLENPDRCERLGQAARERMEQRFDRTVVHLALHDYYHQILGE
jgi:glycosyltransferase involved in cell wall biosynthesis